MSFDWDFFWQQTQNELITALVMIPVVIVVFFGIWWLRKR